MVSLLAFVVLGGGVAWAHGKIGTKDLRNQAVTTPKVSGGAITQAKRRGKVRPRWAVVNANGDLARGRLAASASRIANPGAYAVIFRNSVRGCSYVATPEGSQSPNEQPATVSVRTCALTRGASRSGSSLSRAPASARWPIGPSTSSRVLSERPRKA
jgi:hypothetical protein